MNTTQPELAHAAPSDRREHASARASRERFAPPWLILGVLVATLSALAFLYPRSYLETHLRQHPQPNAATLAYLRLMVMAQPSASDSRILLARAALTAGDIGLADYALTPWRAQDIAQLPLQLARLRLHLLRLELYAAALDSTRKSRLASAYVYDLEQLAPRLDAAALLREAHFAVALGYNPTAAQLYRQVIARASSPKLRREAFQAGIKALLAAGQARAALAFAQREQASLPPSLERWRQLTHLALMAGRSRLAARYARHLVGLKPQ